MKRICICLIMVFLLGAVTAAASEETLDTAFSGDGSFRLVAASLPAAAPEEGAVPVDLSPDGQTVVWKCGSSAEERHLTLTRNGQIIPVHFAAEHGAGDPYGKQERFSGLIIDTLPPWEEFIWSLDGRYFSVSSVRMSTQKMMSLDVAVVDTSTGDLYLAETYNDNFRDPENWNGSVYMSLADRSGKYLYYLMTAYTDDLRVLRFCRCVTEGGEPEVLCETPYDATSPYDIVTGGLHETANGDWLLIGINGKASVKRDAQLSMILFSSSDGTWTAKVIPLGIPYTKLAFAKVSCSPSSGYSLFTLYSQTVSMQSGVAKQTVDGLSSSQVTPYISPLDVVHRVNLMRLLPGDDYSRDFWYLRKTGENPADVEMISAEACLRSLESAIVTGEIVPPEDTDPEESLLRITCACVSPDGYYALLNTLDRDFSGFMYLLNLETMEVRPVEIPEEIDCFMLQMSSISSSYYAPIMKWNDDGTLLILSKKANQPELFRLEW